jgi:hypothetical protein
MMQSGGVQPSRRPWDDVQEGCLHWVAPRTLHGVTMLQTDDGLLRRMHHHSILPPPPLLDAG